MADQGNSKRQNPRWPGHTVWSDDEREAHRLERDRLIREAGLDPFDTTPVDDEQDTGGKPAADQG